jgi:hypothetical protein
LTDRQNGSCLPGPAGREHRLQEVWRNARRVVKIPSRRPGAMAVWSRVYASARTPRLKTLSTKRMVCGLQPTAESPNTRRVANVGSLCKGTVVGPPVPSTSSAPRASLADRAAAEANVTPSARLDLTWLLSLAPFAESLDDGEKSGTMNWTWLVFEFRHQRPQVRHRSRSSCRLSIGFPRARRVEGDARSAHVNGDEGPVQSPGILFSYGCLLPQVKRNTARVRAKAFGCATGSRACERSLVPNVLREGSRPAELLQ